MKEGNPQMKGANERVQIADIAVAVTCGLQVAKGSDWKTGREALTRYFEETWTGRRIWLETPVDKEWDKIDAVEGKP